MTFENNSAVLERWFDHTLLLPSSDTSIGLLRCTAWSCELVNLAPLEQVTRAHVVNLYGDISCIVNIITSMALSTGAACDQA